MALKELCKPPAQYEKAIPYMSLIRRQHVQQSALKSDNGAKVFQLSLRHPPSDF